MRIKKEILEEIYKKIDIVEVIEDFISLRKSGKDWKACCPFHEEKTPSFSVSAHLGIYKCFGCGMGGDGIRFLMEYEKMSFLDAIRYIAKKYDIVIKYERDEMVDNTDKEKEESIRVAIAFAKDFFQKQLIKNTDTKAYLKKRNISDRIINLFELGLNTYKESFKTHALKKGFSEKILLEAGLLQKKEDGTYYDSFQNRLIFPIKNSFGKTVGFGARTLKKGGMPKYLNSPETLVYKKAELLYGLTEARKAIRKHNICYVVEGYMDVLAMQELGVETVVAISGTAVTTEQVRLIKKYTHEIVLMFDSDTAGINALNKSIPLLLSENINIKIIYLPKGEDPDSYSKKVGREAFQEFIQKNAIDFLRFKVNQFLEKKEQTPAEKAEFISSLLHNINHIPDTIKRLSYLKECASLMDISEQQLIYESEKKISQKSKKQQARETTKKKNIPLSPIELQEIETIRLLIHHGDKKINDDLWVCDYLIKELKDITFSNPTLREIFEKYQLFREKNYIPKLADFLTEKDNQIQQMMIDNHYSEYPLSKSWEKEEKFKQKDAILDRVLYKNILYMRKRALEAVREDIKSKIDSDDLDQQKDYIELIMNINKDIQEISQKLTIVIS